jgi:SAM-dependent methyltransferase
MPFSYFTVPLVDLGRDDPRLSGIYIPEPEMGAEKVGITDQFLALAHNYHRKYANEGHYSGLFSRAFSALGGAPVARTVLDIGTGSGVNTIGPLLAQIPGCRIVATDLSPDLLRMLRAYVAAEGLDDRVACICTDAMRNHFRPGAFDLVVGVAILHHLFEPVAALRAAHRALRPGGLAIWFEPFELGHSVLRMAYTLILQRAKECGGIDERTIAALRALRLDTEARTGTDKSAPHFRYMDDKWLFTRTYLQAAAREAGFATAEIIPDAVHRNLYRDTAAIQLRLIDGLGKNALPAWAWEIIDLADRCFSDDAKRDAFPEGTILLRKAA